MTRLILFLFLFSSCVNTAPNNLKDRYVGYWAETKFTYEFLNDNKFLFFTEGHYGSIKINGNYIVNLDTLQLKFENKTAKKDGVIGMKYRIEKNGCITEINNGRSYCDKNDKTDLKKKERDQSICVELVRGVKKVMDRDSLVKLNSEGKRNLSYMALSSAHGRETSEYWVEVVEDNNSNLVTHFNFLVNPESREVKLYDPIVDTFIIVKN